MSLLRLKKKCIRCGKEFLPNGFPNKVCNECRGEEIAEEEVKDNYFLWEDVPKCPDCMMSMVNINDKWCCSNEVCAVINIDVKNGCFVKVVRDSVMASSGEVEFG